MSDQIDETPSTVEETPTAESLYADLVAARENHNMIDAGILLALLGKMLNIQNPE